MSAHFAATVAAILTSTKTDPALLTLEITESVFVQDGERALLVLKDLRDLGYRWRSMTSEPATRPSTTCGDFPWIRSDRQCFIAETQESGHVSRSFEPWSISRMCLGCRSSLRVWRLSSSFKRMAAMECDACQGFFFAQPMNADDLRTLGA
jgi:predicted signal transduction protein with EAL and GGDEF domain